MIFRSTYPPFHIPQGKTIWDYLEKAAIEDPRAPAYICGITDRCITFGEAWQQAKYIAAGLVRNGIKKGDVVMLHSFNCVEYPVVYFALNRIGAICSPSSPMLNAEELALQINTVQASAIITHKKLYKEAMGASGLTNIPRERCYMMAVADSHDTKLQSIEDFINKQLELPEMPLPDPMDVVILPFSSGTSGRPKGVELSGRALLSVALAKEYLDEGNQSFIAVLPFYHIFAIQNFHAMMVLRVKSIVLPRFEPEAFLNVIQKYRPSSLSIVPPIVTFLAKDPRVDKYDLTSLNNIVCGAAPLGAELDRLVSKRLSILMRQGYGMTEFCAGIVGSPRNYAKPGSSGILFPNAELKIKDLDTDEDLGVNKSGELLFRSPQAMNRYLGDEEANKRVFAEDGFIRTGDIGYIDEDGFIFVVDRLKEMIKYKAHQIAPAEIEDAIGAHPKVEDACCVRGKDADGEEIPKAFVVLKPGESATPEEIMKFVAGKVAGFKKVREVEIIDAIPKSASGKILRRQLQERENNKSKKTKLTSKL